MRDRARSEAQRQEPGRESSGPAPSPAVAASGPGRPTPAQALALQRAVGNRAAARTLARWAAHPDKEKKGQFLTDASAEEYMRFNPPKNS